MTLLVGAGALTACGDLGPNDEVSTLPIAPSSARPPQPGPAGTGAGAGAVLRWRKGGGIAGLGGPGSLPDFSLYADGRAVSVPGGGAAPVEFRLKPAAVTRLLDGARAAGLGRSRTVQADGVADAMTLEITLGGARTRVVQPDGRSDPAVRFWTRLRPETWPKADQTAPSRPYVGDRLAALATPTTSTTGNGQKVREWTLAPLAKGAPGPGGLCTVLAGRDAQSLQKESGPPRPRSVWRDGGKVYSLRLRPLLPDEKTCADLARA
ncbi:MULTISPECIES: hypothetical protein [Thermomonosporaceae]|uniref:hypothetical protein n=1 Tax=Thermomonosporaceae TaxID=2012 RepID=UPI00255B1CD3|nr:MULTISPECIES: hypothetical protein [Thermomonosporaceae]MDL4771974.1 hypothetical protein [Actinomadura xylanilytica]